MFVVVESVLVGQECGSLVGYHLRCMSEMFMATVVDHQVRFYFRRLVHGLGGTGHVSIPGRFRLWWVYMRDTRCASPRHEIVGLSQAWRA